MSMLEYPCKTQIKWKVTEEQVIVLKMSLTFAMYSDGGSVPTISIY